MTFNDTRAGSIPKQPMERYAAANGLDIHYRDWGGAGQNIVMLHGLASNCRIWDLVAPMLSEKARVVALDQRGHGKTSKPEGGFEFESVTRDLHAFLEAAGIENPILIGHSWGGDVILEYAVEHPDAAKGIVFVDGGMIDITSRPEMTPERAREEMAPPLWNGVTEAAFRERIRTWKFADVADSAHLQEIVFANFESNPDGTIRSRLSRENHLRIIDTFWGHKPTQLYPKLRVPVLVMPARQKNVDSMADRTWRRENAVSQAQKLIPINKVVWLEDSVHDVPLQRPELVANTILSHLDEGFFEQR
jgi:pimeloyl-ACP methyl ester carboxylesterase